jgi:glycosyltransferase involved in cell wall biosynthesis
MTTTESGDGDGAVAADSSGSVRTSIVLPAYDEAATLQGLVPEILEDLGEHPAYGPYEIVVVDDGSTDDTRAVLSGLVADYPEVTAVVFSRNFGQSAALKAGFDHADGEVIVPMDADGQNDPADVPALLAKLDEGYDCVSGWRRDRNDPLAKTLPSAIQTKLARLTGPDIHDFGCTLKAYRAAALEDIELYGEGHRYIPAKLYDRGYRIGELPVNHRPRTAGTSKYGFKRLLKGFVDLLFHVFWNRFSTRPVHFLGGLGVLSFGIGTVVGLHAVAVKYGLGRSLAPELLPRLIFVVAVILFGVILIMFGFLAEMITMVYYRERTPYRIEEISVGRPAEDREDGDAS